MKKFLIIIACAGFLNTANAQTSAATTTDLKEHACSDACTKQAHALVHGEQGHTCTAACTTASTEKKAGGCCAGKKEGASCAKGAKTQAHAEAHAEGGAAKDHVCTAACAEAKHAYVCGEKGHECGTACAHAH